MIVGAILHRITFPTFESNVENLGIPNEYDFVATSVGRFEYAWNIWNRLYLCNFYFASFDMNTNTDSW